MAVRCPSCAEEIPSDARFCPFCGHHVETGTEADDPTVALTPADPDATTRIDAARTTPVDADATSRIDPAPTGPTRACPRCGATNSAQRATCGRCEADLETGTPTLRDPGDAHGYADEERDGADGSSGRRVALVLLVAALIGAAIGLFLWFGADEDPTAEGAVFDEGVYPEDPVGLEVASIDASSASTSDDEVTSPQDLLDRDPATAWVAEGEEGEEGEILSIRFPQAVWIGAVSVWNGDQSGEETFGDHARARRLDIITDDRTTIEIVLADEEGEQAAVLPDPVLVRTITVEVAEVTDGGEDIALSGLEFRGWEARGADRSR